MKIVLTFKDHRLQNIQAYIYIYIVWYCTLIKIIKYTSQDIAITPKDEHVYVDINHKIFE